MPKLKTFTLGVNGFARSAVIEALGLPNRVRQAHIIAAAKTKKAAHELLEQHKVFIPLSNSEFRADHSLTAQGLVNAGLLDEPGVLAIPMDVGSEVRVVRLLPGGDCEFIGTLTRTHSPMEYVFEGKDEA
jgi:hypothetical protein